jgi:hypothetical protein
VLTSRELATVLAALRYWQRDLESADEIIDDGEHFADQLPLTTIEIGDLCERLNGTAASSLL